MLPLALTAAGVLALDLLTKIWVRSALPLYAEIPVLPFFSLVHIENTGVVFGLFQGKNHLFAVAGLIAAGAIAWMAARARHEDLLSAHALALVFGGAVGNLIDRWRLGRVTDFLDFFVAGWHWPAFNVADSAICVGAALLMWRSFRPAAGVKA